MALPQRTDPTKLEELVPQDKMFEVFSEYTRWVDVIGVANIGSLNARILEGGGSDLIRIAEALHEKALGNLADRIYERHRDGGARIVLISGPSSSGKTTFAKRLGIQLSILGMRPVLGLARRLFRGPGEDASRRGRGVRLRGARKRSTSAGSTTIWPPCSRAARWGCRAITSLPARASRITGRCAWTSARCF